MRLPSLRRAAPWLLGLFGALLAAGLLAAALALQSAPTVPLSRGASLQDIARLNALLQRHDPRYARPGQVRAAVLLPRDIELAMAQAARRLHLPPHVAAAVQDGRATLRASVPLTLLGRPFWLNVDCRVDQTRRLPELGSLWLGRLPVPAGLAAWLAPRVLERLGLQGQADFALGLINRVNFTRGQQAVVVFSYPYNLEQRLADVLLSETEQARLKVHAEHLARLSRDLARGPGPRLPVSLTRLLVPMFQLARERTALGEDAALENRAVLLTLTSYLNGRGLHALVPEARTWKPLPMLKVTLAGRDDTPKHYLVSAVLSIQGGEALSNAIGVYKEVSDAQGGTGFSFNDLAADRAGTRFGLASQRQAAALQQRVAALSTEGELLPPISDLPEDMQDPEFQRRFGGVDGLGYQRVTADIEARLDRLPLLAAEPGPGARSGPAAAPSPAGARTGRLNPS